MFVLLLCLQHSTAQAPQNPFALPGDNATNGLNGVDIRVQEGAIESVILFCKLCQVG